MENSVLNAPPDELFAAQDPRNAEDTAPDGAQAVQAKASGEADDVSMPPRDRAELRKEFEELIRGRYREVFAARVKEILVKRFRERAKEAPAEPAPKAGVEKGPAPDAESAAFVPSPEEVAQAAEKYPGFRLEAELEDPDFVRLCGAGFPLCEAYEIVHRASLADERARASAAAEAERVWAELTAAGRLSEAGRGGSVARTGGVERMTLKEREALERRALKGEKIIL